MQPLEGLGQEVPPRQRVRPELVRQPDPQLRQTVQISQRPRSRRRAQPSLISLQLPPQATQAHNHLPLTLVDPHWKAMLSKCVAPSPRLWARVKGMTQRLRRPRTFKLALQRRSQPLPHRQLPLRSVRAAAPRRHFRREEDPASIDSISEHGAPFMLLGSRHAVWQAWPAKQKGRTKIRRNT